MNVFGKYFEFDGVSSEIYDVILCSFDAVDKDRPHAISYNLSTTEISSTRSIVNLYDKKYNDVLEFKIEICKNPEGTEHFFPLEEQNKIIRWLTSPTEYRQFNVVDYCEDSYSNYHTNTDYFCSCVDYGETVINGNIAGLYFVFQCNSPYAFYKEQVTEFESTSSATTSFIIDNYSDETKMAYYPIIELTPSATGEITIVNDQYPEEKMVLYARNGQELCIDNLNGDITDNIDLFKYSTDTNLVWLRLNFGENKITITGDTTGKVRCRYPRKVGI